MKVSRIIGIAAIGLFVTAEVFAQSNILNAKNPDEIGRKTEAELFYDDDKPLPYGYVGERDILWSKTTWEIIDLNERKNFPYYYPIDTMNIGPDRRSLYHVLIKNIKNGRIPRIYVDAYFTEERKLAELGATIKKVDTLDYGKELLNMGETLDPQYVVETNIDAAHVEQFRVRGVWYIDKVQGELKYRIVGIAPVAPDVNFLEDEENSDLVELFWVYFPDAREVLNEAKVYNQSNSAQYYNYDHMLNSRMFSGVMYKEDNVYGDREIDHYIPDNALMQLLESERMKERIRDLEMNLWNY